MLNRQCISWHEWFNTGGMGERCKLKLIHEGNHKGPTIEWARTAEEIALLHEIDELEKDNTNISEVLWELQESLREQR